MQGLGFQFCYHGLQPCPTYQLSKSPECYGNASFGTSVQSCVEPGIRFNKLQVGTYGLLPPIDLFGVQCQDLWWLWASA